MLKDRRFVQLFLAGVASDFGDALHYIALMWFALEIGGPIGVMVVRLADSVPALAFGLYGGVLADRFPRRALLIGADLVRGGVLLPLASTALTGKLGIVQLAMTAFVLETCASLFAPAHGALLPELIGRDSIQRGNALIRATHHAVSVGGWAAAAALLAVMPMGMFFAINAASFFVSALFLLRMPAPVQQIHSTPPRVAEGLFALKQRPHLALGVLGLWAATTVGSGSWIAGLPKLIKSGLHRDAAAFSLTMTAYAVGAFATGLVFTRVKVTRKVRASLMCWGIELPGFVLFATASELYQAMLGAVMVGISTSSGRLLLVSAAQEQAPAAALGRVMGIVSLVDRGSRAFGLLLIAPLYGWFPERPLLLGTGVLLFVIALAGLALSRRYQDATELRVEE